MIRLLILSVAAAMGMSATANSDADFDYFILALSWNSGFCEVEGEAKGAEICDPRHDYGFRLHGLWPQNAEGYPEFCQSVQRNPSRAETAREADLFGSAGYAWHQWNKHGRCTGLSAQDYYDRSRAWFENFQAPQLLLDVKDPLRIPPNVIEDAIIEENPALSGESMAVICRDGVFVELRVCLDKEGAPTQCLGSAARDCEYTPEFLPIR